MAPCDDDEAVEVGEQNLLTVAFRDVTEQRRTEEALRLAEATSSGILSISADAIISIDESQRIRFFNEGAEKIFGMISGTRSTRY